MRPFALPLIFGAWLSRIRLESSLLFAKRPGNRRVGVSDDLRHQQPRGWNSTVLEYTLRPSHDFAILLLCSILTEEHKAAPTRASRRFRRSATLRVGGNIFRPATERAPTLRCSLIRLGSEKGHPAITLRWRNDPNHPELRICPPTYS